MAHEIRIQVADTPRTQELGYQFVKDIPEMTGMLFKFQQPNELNFWMQNTYVPLDIAFIADDGTVINTDHMVPLSLRSVKSASPCRLALEVPAGTLNRIGVASGAKAEIDLEEGVVRFDDRH